MIGGFIESFGGDVELFYEIKIEVGYKSLGSSLKATSYIKKFKLFWKEDLIDKAKRETDSRIINQLNHTFDDCSFNFLKAYRKYGVVFYGTAEIRNRVTGKWNMVYSVYWERDYWNLELYRYKDKEFKLI